MKKLIGFAFVIMFAFSLAQEQSANLYLNQPSMKWRCVDEKNLDTDPLSFGPNLCGFIVYSPQGIDDAVRVDYEITVYFRSRENRQWVNRERTTSGYLPMRNAAAGAVFQVNTYDPNLGRSLFRQVKKLVTIENVGRFAKGFFTGGTSLTVDLKSLSEVEQLFESIDQNLFPWLIKLSVRVCNSSNNCTPDLIESKTIRLE